MERNVEHENLIADYMQFPRYDHRFFGGIGNLWPVLEKIRKECEGNTIYLQKWMIIAMGLQAVKFDVIYMGVVGYIQYHNQLNIQKQN